MITLSYGFQKPQTGDKGSVFFLALEGNTQKLNDHTHNGTNSAKLSAAGSAAVIQAISSAGWVAQGGGTFRQLVTLPAALTTAGGTYDDFSIQMRNASTGSIMYLHVIKTSATTYYVYINDNSIDLKAVYT